jgi:hypothetical protein
VTRSGLGLWCLWLFRVVLVLPPFVILLAFAGVWLTATSPQNLQSGQVALVIVGMPLAGFWLVAMPVLGLLAWLTRPRHTPPA